jgi:hypothetical protein
MNSVVEIFSHAYLALVACIGILVSGLVLACVGAEIVADKIQRRKESK